MKLLTVTVPCYNSQDYMENCIQSLLIGGERVEIIVIDDGSKDNTGRIADEYAEKYPSIVRVIHQKNGGHGEGINQGLEYASGTYFKVVDSDDTLSTDFPAFLDTLEECEKKAALICWSPITTMSTPMALATAPSTIPTHCRRTKSSAGRKPGGSAPTNC